LEIVDLICLPAGRRAELSSVLLNRIVIGTKSTYFDSRLSFRLILGLKRSSRQVKRLRLRQRK